MATVLDSKPAVAVMDMELDDTDLPKRGGRKIEEKSLDEYGFITGDLLSVSLYIPEPKIPAGAPRMGQVAAAPGVTGPGAKSFGWGERQPREREIHPSERGAWHKGESLPPQSFRGGAAGRGGDREFAGGGSWRGGGSGMGIRGAKGRSPERHGDRRSGSPDGRERRVSWTRRRGD